MKRIIILFAIVLLFSGGTAITRQVHKKKGSSAIADLSSIASKMDSTSTKLDHSSAVLENLR